MSEVASLDHHGTPSHLSVGGSSGWNTPTPTWTEGTPSYTESSKSGMESGVGGLGQSSLDDVCDVCFGLRDRFFLLFPFVSFFTQAGDLRYPTAIHSLNWERNS